MAHRTKKAGGKAKIWERVGRGDFRALDERVLTDEEIREVAEGVKGEVAFGSVLHMIEAIPARGRDFDWNIGNLLQHFEPDLAISAVQHAANRKALYDSVGLAWAFGQFRNRNRFVVDFLQSVVREAQNGDAWWQAAFSLENLGADNAVNLLKRAVQSEELRDLSYYLRNLEDKRSLVAVLVLSDEQTQAKIYPVIAKAIAGKSERLLVNCLWLAGRLRIFDDAIIKKAIALTESPDHDIRHYAYFALQNCGSDAVRGLFERNLTAKDSLSRKFAARGLRVIGSQDSVNALMSALKDETDPVVIFEITKSVNRLKNPLNAERLRIRQSAYRHENGALATGKIDPSLYDRFTEAHDSEGICFTLLRGMLRGRKIVNPVDIHARTGSLTRKLFDALQYGGTLYGVDEDRDMCAYASRTLRRERNFQKPVEIVNGSPTEFAGKLRGKSSLVVSTFRYRGQDAKSRIEELKAIYSMMTEDGLYVTVGWDELYSDAALTLWYKYVPDGIAARDFEEWRQRRMTAGSDRSSDGLTWVKRGINSQLQFHSMDDAANVVGHLFGRDAAQYAIRNQRTQWGLSLGITCDTKRSLAAAIDALENVSEE